MSDYQCILVENHDDGVSIFTINRPDRRNALSATVVKELQQAFLAFDEDPTRRVAVLTGAGNDAFFRGCRY